MEIREYLAIFRAKWWVVVAALVVGLVAGYLYALFADTSYKSCSQVFVTTDGGSSVGEAYQNNLFSQERVNSYARVATSEQVSQRVVDQLHLQVSPSTVQGRITATPVEKTVLLDICTSDSSAASAQALTGAVTAQTVQVVRELETPSRGGNPAAGATVVDDASGGVESGASALKFGLLGAVAGLLIGIALALALGLLNRRIGDRAKVDEITRGGVIASVPADPQRPETRVTDLGSGAPIAESVRTLRNNLHFLGKDTEPRVIVVTSPDADTGRSTLAIDLAAVIAESGASVALVDGDLRGGSLSRTLQVGERRGLSDVLAGNSTVPTVVQNGTVDGVAVVVSGKLPPNPGELLAFTRAQAVIDDLRGRFDYVVVDTPPVLSYGDAAVLAALGDGALVLTRIGRTSRDALRRTIRSLEQVGATILGNVTVFDGKATVRPSRPTAENAVADRPVEAATDEAHTEPAGSPP
ncbi:polysaccharide biosynthesis tyrosine autokinase [Williamsia sterculiae]|uniref:Receptor protein-tyrosine kinase n=1 Tax=Williamsia sterculiae TaxID=1344003 RepID=A0A1N7CZR3_9NOCA|nr:polysaccharide biosynthesis tyrosine autokinase [Williamsia sterculiae]SIR69083.1 receptor protein-tyrosine kinase [Williamsia sterculiae]